MDILEWCRNCTLSGKVFFRILWWGMLNPPDLLCRDSITDVSKFAVITDAVCNSTSCIDVYLKPRSIIYREEFWCFHDRVEVDLAADVGSGDFALEEDTKVDDNIEQASHAAGNSSVFNMFPYKNSSGAGNAVDHPIPPTYSTRRPFGPCVCRGVSENYMYWACCIIILLVATHVKNPRPLARCVRQFVIGCAQRMVRRRRSPPASTTPTTNALELGEDVVD